MYTQGGRVGRDVGDVELGAFVGATVVGARVVGVRVVGVNVGALVVG